MTGREHLAIGAGSTVLLMAGSQFAQGGVDGTVLASAGIAAAAGSLAPDMDHPGSLASLSIPSALIGPSVGFLAWRAWNGARPDGLLSSLVSLSDAWVPWAWTCLAAGVALFVASWVLGRVFGHRGPVHSVAFGVATTALVTSGLAVAGAPTWLALPFLWGWLAHLAADAITPAGLKCVLWPVTGRP